jgi:TolA-binding protein
MRVTIGAVLVLSVLLAPGCRKKQPVTTVSPTPTVTTAPTPVAPPPSPAALALEAANQAFALGDYPSAASSFARYLELAPVGGERDDVLFKLGVIHALPGQQDWTRASGLLNQLMSEFPQSPLRVPAQLILSIREESTQLSTDISRLTKEATQLRTELSQMKTSSAESAEAASRLTNEITQLRQQADVREQRIRQLNSDLERLIRIDSQNRPRPQ